MDTLNLIGRIVLAVFFVLSGLGHFRAADAMTAYTAAKGVPFPRLSVLGSGVLLIAGGLSIALGVWADLGAIVLTVFVAVAAVTMHDFWAQRDPATRSAEWIHFTKNVGLAGATLCLFAFLVSTGSDLGLTLTDPLIKP